MKLMFLASDLARPGQGMQLARLALAAKEAGAEVARVVSLGSEGEPGAWLKAKGVEVKALDARSWKTFFGLLRLAWLLVRTRPDVLQTWGFQANLAGKALGFFCGAKNIVSSLRSPETPKNMELERITSFLASAITANSSWNAAFGKSCGLPKDLLSATPNAFDAETFKRKERRRPAKDEKWRILFLGDRRTESGMPVLLGALAGLAKSGLNFKAVFAGPSTPRLDLEILAQLETHGLSGRIELKERVSRERVMQLMENAHLLVAPAVFDWTPNTLLEAFASGLPVVATNIEGTKELVIDGRTGRLAAPADASSLAKAIAEAIMEYDMSLRMARDAWKLGNERCNPQKSHAEHLKLYEKLLQAPPPKPKA